MIDLIFVVEVQVIVALVMRSAGTRWALVVIVVLVQDVMVPNDAGR